MRSLSVRSLSLPILTLALMVGTSSPAFASSVTISGAPAFSSLDGGADDADHLANGVFTVAGDLVVNGTVSCSGAASACSMSFAVSGNMVMNPGSALLAESRSGNGSGGAIKLQVGGDLTLRGSTATLAGAVVSTHAETSSRSNGGDVTATVSGSLSVEKGAIVDSGATNGASGKIAFTSGGASSIDGLLVSGPGRQLLPTGRLSGGTANSTGGAIHLQSTAFAEPGLTIGSSAVVISQSASSAAGPVTLEACGIVVNGLVAGLSEGSHAIAVSLRSGKGITIDGRDLGVTTGSLGRNGRVVADSNGGPTLVNNVAIYARGSITILGPSDASAPYAISGSATAARGTGAAIAVASLDDGVTLSGNAISANALSSGGSGGSVDIDAKADVNLAGAAVRAAGDFATNNSNRHGGAIAVRSFSGKVLWTNGSGDARPTGSSVSAAARGSIAITACSTISLTGSTWPSNGAPVGVYPQTTTGVCSPAAPQLPEAELPLQTCNTPPTADAQSVSILEDTAVTITLTGSDPDSQPLTFSIVAPPAHGSLGPIFNATATSAQVVYTPGADENGADSFTFAVDDGNGGTATAVVAIDITPVNDAPSFNAGTSPQTSLEDGGPQFVSPWASGISAGAANESSQHVTFSIASNSNEALFSTGPSVTPSGALSYSAASNAFGSATLTVVAHDDGGTANGGVDTSAAQTFTINITAVNDAPSFSKGADVTVLEDSGPHSEAGWATAISAGPGETQNVTFVVTNDNNALFASQPGVDASGTLTFTPAANANGTATVSVAAHDDGGTANGGIDTSPVQTFTITVGAVNDAPSFTRGADQTVLEDSGPQSVAGWASAISAGPADESAQVVTFTVTTDNPALFTVQPALDSAGALTFTTAPDAFGTATISVVAHDDGGTANGGVDTSAAQSSTITVTGVNDAPSFTKGADATVLEDSAAHAVSGWATAISAGPGETQNVTFVVTNDNNALFASQPGVDASGTLTFTPAANANGTATVSVAAHDDGGTANGGIDTSPVQTFTITVGAVNDAPSFTRGADQTVLEDSGPHSVPGWASAISAGPADESAQVVTFTVTADNPALFTVQPALDSAGTLTFTTAPDAFGTATISVVAQDNGGTANGGVDTSAAQTFTITVTGVNDAPSFTKGADVAVLSNAGPQAYSGWATGIAAGPANESAQLVSFIISNDNNAAFSAQPAVSSAGTLTFTTNSNAPTTTVHVTVAAHDDGGTANGGIDTSAAQTFAINVTHANAAPVATPDSFDAVGNTELAVGTTGAQAATLSVSGSVLSNDSDPDGDPLTATAGAASPGASLSMNSDGSFRYLPPAGFTGDDTFSYVVSDGQGHNVNGSVTIHVVKRVLYVSNNAGGSSGRVDSPYPTLAAAQAAAADNDTVYVFTGDGTTTGQDAGFAVNHDGERLIGEGTVLTAAGTYNAVANPTLRAAGTQPKISNSAPATAAVTVAKVSGTINNTEVSGIEITSSASHGVFVTAATNVVMSKDKISGIGGSGVRGTKVTNFSFTNGRVDGSGVNTNDSSIAFDDSSIGTENNLSGTVTISNNTFNTPLWHGVDIQNFSGTITSADISGNTITSATTTAASKGAGIRLIANGTAAGSASVTKATISTNKIANFPSGAGILLQGGNASSTGPASTFGLAGDAANAIAVTNNSISGQSAAVRIGTNAIAASVNGRGQANFVITGNGTAAAPLTNVTGTAISVSAFGQVTASAQVDGNVIVANNSFGAQGISIGADRTFLVTDAPQLTATVSNNTVSATDGNGIFVIIRNSAAAGKVQVLNNSVAAPITGPRPGIRVDSGSASGSTALCVDIRGNVSAGNGMQGIGLRKQGTNSVVNAYSIVGMAATATPGVEAYVDGLNPAGGGTVLLSATSGYTSCSLP